MDKDELLERIKKGEAYLERTDLTDGQRKVAGERYESLVRQLGELEDAEAEQQKVEPPSNIPPKVREEMNKIRGILGKPTV